MTLFDLTAEYKAILAIAEDEETDPDIIAFHLEEIGGKIEDKADSIAYILTQLQGDVETLKKEEERLQNRRKSIENNALKLKLYLETAMRETNKLKFKTTYHSFGIQKNPPSVSVFDDRSIPERFLIPQEPKIDKRAILAELKAGEEFDWCEMVQTEGLRIR